MGSSNERKIILVVEVLDNIAAEKESSASRTQTPSFDFVGIGPEEIAHGTFVGDFLFSVK
jgi:hypothetical protein